MIITTTRFGEIEIDPNQIITFEQGIPGFHDQKRFTIIPLEENSPFHFLQAVDEADLCFIITDPFVFYESYEFAIPESIQEQLKIRKQEDVAIWSVITILDGLDTATINLLGPIVINVNEKRGKQIILHDSFYETKHPLLVKQQSETRGG